MLRDHVPHFLFSNDPFATTKRDFNFLLAVSMNSSYKLNIFKINLDFNHKP